MSGRVTSRYTPLGRLGSGHFANVALFRDAVLEREVAIKFFKPAQVPVLPPLDEIRRAARLDHAHIVQVFDVLEVAPAELDPTDPHDEAALSTYAIVMQRVTGPALAAMVGSDVSETRIVDWATQIAKALRHAHTHPGGGLVHGDLHAGNVLLHHQSSGAVAMVTDWGVSTLVDEHVAARGHVFSCAPEAWERAVPASDYWALGLLLAQLMGRVNLHSPDDLRDRMGQMTGPDISDAMRDRALTAVSSHGMEGPAPDLVHALLHRDPSLRGDYARVHQAAEDLRERNRARWRPQPVVGDSSYADDAQAVVTSPTEPYHDESESADGSLFEPIDRRTIITVFIVIIVVALAVIGLAAMTRGA